MCFTTDAGGILIYMLCYILLQHFLSTNFVLQPVNVEALDGALSPSVVNIEGVLLPRFPSVTYLYLTNFNQSSKNLNILFSLRMTQPRNP